MSTAPRHGTNGTHPESPDEVVDRLFAWWPGSAPAAAPLPEAPASVNCHLTIAGRQVQLTLRDTDETRLLARLEAVLAQYPQMPLEAPRSPQAPTAPGTRHCPLHGTEMRRHENANGVWYSHYIDGAHCKGKGVR